MQTILMPVRWEPPPPPPCVKCGTTTAIDPVFEQGQRTFVVRCPACRHVHTYSLDYDTLRKGGSHSGVHYCHTRRTR